jgi:hypothetical protein
MVLCYRPAVCVVASLWALAVAAAGEAAKPAASAPFFDATLRPFVKAYCFGCHSGRDAEHGIQLDKYQFVRCLAEKLLTYAIGRGVEPFDKPAVEQIARSLAGKEYRFSALVLGIVYSDPFQKRRGKDGLE